MDINLEKLEYLINDMEPKLCEMIGNVLSDSETDPEFSAVTTTNRIKCYIEVMNDLGKKLPYGTVKEFFDFNFFTDEEYDKFECSRKKESEYYIGVQY